MAQPRGSLLFHRSRRFWRFSPAQLLAEDLCILYRLYQGWLPYRAPRRRGWRAFRIGCHAILVLREGNIWGKEDYDGFFSRNENERYVEGGGDGIEGLPLVGNGLSSASGFQDVRGFDTAGMSYRSPSSQLGHAIELEPQSSDLGIPHSSLDIAPPCLISLQGWFSRDQPAPE